ncbi:MAG: NAD(P) transhydrogenase subunit alpha [Planctomycetales bacterium]
MIELLSTNAISLAMLAADGASASASNYPERMVLLLTVFVLAVVVGVEIITKIPPTLHTPLMSGSNAISGITLIGAVILAGTGVRVGLESVENVDRLARILGFLAVVLATVNVVGGFLVTHRMLGMFRKKDVRKREE